MDWEGFSEMTLKQRPEESEGWVLGGRAFQAEGTVHAKATRRSGKAIRLCSPVDHSQGFDFYAEKAGRGLFSRVT